MSFEEGLTFLPHYQAFPLIWFRNFASYQGKRHLFKETSR